MKWLKKFRALFNPVDLTTGSIYKKMILFVIPITLSLLFTQLYHLADAAIIGQTLSEAEIAGVNNSGALTFLVLEFGYGCTTGFSVIIAERIGAKDKEGARKSLFTQLVLGVFVSIFMTAVSILALPYLLHLMGITPSATDASMNAVYEAATTYLLIIFGGSVFIVFYEMIAAILRAKGDSFIPFLILVAGTMLNVGLDLLFILVFHWGVAGSAIATVAAQGLAALAAFIYAFKRYPDLRIHKEDTRVPWATYARHLNSGIPMGLQFSILAIGMMLMQSMINAFDILPDGTFIASLPSQIGYGAGCKVVNFLAVPLNGIGTGALAFIGQNVGAKNEDRIRKGFKAAMVIGTVLWAVGATIGLLLTINGAYQYIFLSPTVITPESIKYGNAYLWVSLPAEFFLMALFVTRNALMGLEKPLWPLLCGFAELAVRAVLCLWVPILINGGNPINSEAPLLAYYSVVAADAIAWLVPPIICWIPCLKGFHQAVEKKSNIESLSERQ